jgi:hypothetical protein
MKCNVDVTRLRVGTSTVEIVAQVSALVTLESSFHLFHPYAHRLPTLHCDTIRGDFQPKGGSSITALVGLAWTLDPRQTKTQEHQRSEQ